MSNVPEHTPPAGERDPLLAELFAQEVPEVASGQVEVRAAVREPHVLAKVLVRSSDPAIDPMEACTGSGAIHVDRIAERLEGERIELLLWHDSPEVLIARALGARAVQKVAVDWEKEVATVTVAYADAGAVVGRRGINIELAQRLCGWRLNIDVTDLPP